MPKTEFAGTSRNAPCPCGSGKRYKDCHGVLDGAPPSQVAAPTDRPASPLAAHERLSRSLAIERRLLSEGEAIHRQGAAGRARQRYEQVLALDAEHPDAWHLLALLDADAGELESALVKVRRAIATYPRHAPFYVTEARLLVRLGRRIEAEEALRHACGPNVERPEFWLIRQDRGAVELVPTTAPMDVGLRPAPHLIIPRAPTPSPGSDQFSGLLASAQAMRSEGRLVAAEQALRDALAILPADEGALMGLGRVLAEMLRYDEAAEVYRRAVPHSGPDDVEATAELARSLVQIGQASEARRIAQNGLKRHPHSLRLALAANLSLSPVYESKDELDLTRVGYGAGLKSLQEMGPKFLDRPVVETIHAVEWSNFYLAYQGGNDRALQSAYGDFVASILDAVVPELRQPMARTSISDRRIRIGFASHYFYDCSAGSYFRNWIAHLDRARFEVFVYHFRPSMDAVSRAIAATADRFRAFGDDEFAGPHIRRDDLDILVYPELGGNGRTFLLASLRLAPVQCAGWGHPVTTGLPTIDYFFSSDLMEPADAEEHYRERLVRLPGIGTDYAPPPLASLPAKDEARRLLGLPAERRLYLFPQSIYKIHPDNDELLARVLRSDPSGMLLLFPGHTPETTEQFLQRFAKRLATVGLDIHKCVAVLPIMARDTYLRVNVACDVMLDSLHWSGGNTSLDAFAAGLPVVTLPGDFMRGRQTLGMLRVLGLDELVAQDANEYVNLAIDIATNESRQRSLRERILASHGKLFHDRSAIVAMEDFYRSLYGGQTAVRD